MMTYIIIYLFLGLIVQTINRLTSKRSYEAEPRPTLGEHLILVAIWPIVLVMMVTYWLDGLLDVIKKLLKVRI